MLSLTTGDYCILHDCEYRVVDIDVRGLLTLELVYPDRYPSTTPRSISELLPHQVTPMDPMLTLVRVTEEYGGYLLEDK